MDMIRVRGGRSLSGSVCASGSKNASLPILAACLLVDGPVQLDNVPRVKDILGMLHMLSMLGVESEWLPDGGLRIEVMREDSVEAPYHLVRQMRASFCLLGPLWAKRGQAVVSMPGGCSIGERPVDLHLKGLAGLGAKLELEAGNINCTGTVRGGSVYLGGNFGSTVLGTANVLMAAALAEGPTEIEYAAQEPEIVDLCDFLVACGARISGIGSHRLQVQGVKQLHGCHYSVIPDRIEAGTLLCAGFMTRGEVEILGSRPEHLGAVLDRFRHAGLPFECGTKSWVDDEAGGDRLSILTPSTPGSRLRARSPSAPLMSYSKVEPEGPSEDRGPGGRGSEARGSEEGVELPFIRTLPWDRMDAVDISTMPYPGFPTDLQAQFMALMCCAEGVSVITEKIYPERFIHVAELNRLGARIRRESSVSIVQGGQELSGATVMASDLRASAALVLAGLVADGHTDVRRVYHLDRGYEGLEDKLGRLGGDVTRMQEN